MSLPGVKRIIRYIDDDGLYRADAVVLEGEHATEKMFHPFEKEKFMSLTKFKSCEITRVFMEKGEVISRIETAGEIREKVIDNLSHLPAEHKRFEFPHIYKVGISQKLMDLRETLRNR